MKKILLSIFALAVLGITAELNAQCNTTVPVIKWPLVQNPVNLPNIPYAPQATGVAPFAIDGLMTDWETYLLGSPTGVAASPFTPPAYSASNWSQDGISGSGDLDNPTPPRDLRFFAFTKDDKNVFFYFRRINNNSSQNDYYYFLDIMSSNNTVLAPDGYMNDGEPVIRLQYTNGQSGNMQVEILRYVVNTGVDYVAGMGNRMVSPVTNLADGYSMVGSAVSVTPPNTQPGEFFAGKETEAGFGVEFAVPYSYLKNWATNSAAIGPNNIFTYHISLTNGSGINGTQDNAGGCCSGVAVSENPLVTKTGHVAQAIPGQTKARVFVTYTNNRAATTTLNMNQVKFKISDFSPVGAVNLNNVTVTVYPDATCSNPVNPVGGSIYQYNNLASVPDTAVFTNTSPSTASVILQPNLSGCFVAVVDFGTPSVKSATIIFSTTAEYTNISTGTCVQQALPSDINVPIGISTTLPVDFKSFTATRNRSSVLLKWETSSEINNSGFAVERNMNGIWEQIAFVNSQAANGNSDVLLTYTYNDLNNAKGITQYRIKQVDFDNKSKYTEIRSVRGLDQIGKVTVYPNPTSNGTVNVVFDDASATRTISVLDMSGRTLKQINNVTNNNITIDNLQPGMYTLRIMVPETGEQTVQKIVVNKR